MEYRRRMLEVLLVKIARGDQEGLLRALKETLRIFLEAASTGTPGAQRREVVSQLVAAVGLEARGVLEGGVHSARTFAQQVAARLEQAASRGEEGGREAGGPRSIEGGGGDIEATGTLASRPRAVDSAQLQFCRCEARSPEAGRNCTRQLWPEEATSHRDAVRVLRGSGAAPPSLPPPPETGTSVYPPPTWLPHRGQLPSDEGGDGRGGATAPGNRLPPDAPPRILVLGGLPARPRPLPLPEAAEAHRYVERGCALERAGGRPLPSPDPSAGPTGAGATGPPLSQLPALRDSRERLRSSTDRHCGTGAAVHEPGGAGVLPGPERGQWRAEGWRPPMRADLEPVLMEQIEADDRRGRGRHVSPVPSMAETRCNESARPEAPSPPGSDDEDLLRRGTPPDGGPLSTSFRGTQQPGEESLPLPLTPGSTQPADGHQPRRDGLDDGWCLACGQVGAAGGACQVCGGPVEPADQTSHYQHGWVPGPRAPGVRRDSGWALQGSRMLAQIRDMIHERDSASERARQNRRSGTLIRIRRLHEEAEEWRRIHTPRTSFSLRIDKNQDRINQLREMLDEGEQPLCQVRQANCEPEACGAREFGAHSTGGHGASALRTLADRLEARQGERGAGPRTASPTETVCYGEEGAGEEESEDAGVGTTLASPPPLPPSPPPRPPRAPPQDRRGRHIDFEGGAYTFSEVESYYGRQDAPTGWGLTNPAPAAARPRALSSPPPLSLPPPQDRKGRHTDFDGVAYTFGEFESYYGRQDAPTMWGLTHPAGRHTDFDGVAYPSVSSSPTMAGRTPRRCGASPTPPPPRHAPAPAPRNHRAKTAAGKTRPRGGATAMASSTASAFGAARRHTNAAAPHGARGPRRGPSRGPTD